MYRPPLTTLLKRSEKGGGGGVGGASDRKLAESPNWELMRRSVYVWTLTDSHENFKQVQIRWRPAKGDSRYQFIYDHTPPTHPWMNVGPTTCYMFDMTFWYS